jgi:hypothetical protein
VDRETERIIRNMSGEELALWLAMGGNIPAGCVAIFEASAVRRETIAELVGRPRPAKPAPAVAVPLANEPEQRKAAG